MSFGPLQSKPPSFEVRLLARAVHWNLGAQADVPQEYAGWVRADGGMYIEAGKGDAQTKLRELHHSR